MEYALGVNEICAGWFASIGLNPYYNGICSRSVWSIAASYNGMGLNPYYNGICLGASGTKRIGTTGSGVLILIIMEYALGDGDRTCKRICEIVLILIIMEYALGESRRGLSTQRVACVLILIIMEYALGV